MLALPALPAMPAFAEVRPLAAIAGYGTEDEVLEAGGRNTRRRLDPEVLPVRAKTGRSTTPIRESGALEGEEPGAGASSSEPPEGPAGAEEPSHLRSQRLLQMRAAAAADAKRDAENAVALAEA